MELHVLGAGPAYTNRPGALGAAYLLKRGEAALLLDLGQGAFPSLARAIEPSTLLGVAISHPHPDHFVDLVPLRHYLRYEFEPCRRLAIHGPEGLAGRLDALFGEPGFAAAALDFHPFTDEPLVAGPFTITQRPVTHTPDSHAFRVTWGEPSGLVYSGDCGVAADLAPLLQPGDVLLVEISFGAGPVPVGALHLDGPSIGELAADRRPSRILLTHLQMGFDRADAIASVRERFDGDVRLVAPGDLFQLD